MTVPCGGTGVSREKRMQTSSRANTRAPISGLFCFSAVRSIFDCPPVLQNRIIKEQADGQNSQRFHCCPQRLSTNRTASRWAQAPSHLQHPASLDSQREDAHSAGFLILLARMAEKTALKTISLGLVGVALG